MRKVFSSSCGIIYYSIYTIFISFLIFLSMGILTEKGSSYMSDLMTGVTGTIIKFRPFDYNDGNISTKLLSVGNVYIEDLSINMNFKKSIKDKAFIINNFSAKYLRIRSADEEVSKERKNTIPACLLKSIKINKFKYNDYVINAYNAENLQWPLKKDFKASFIFRDKNLVKIHAEGSDSLVINSSGIKAVVSRINSGFGDFAVSYKDEFINGSWTYRNKFLKMLSADTNVLKFRLYFDRKNLFLSTRVKTVKPIFNFPIFDATLSADKSFVDLKMKSKQLSIAVYGRPSQLEIKANAKSLKIKGIKIDSNLTGYYSGKLLDLKGPLNILSINKYKTSIKTNIKVSGFLNKLSIQNKESKKLKLDLKLVSGHLSGQIKSEGLKLYSKHEKIEISPDIKVGEGGYSVQFKKGLYYYAGGSLTDFGGLLKVEGKSFHGNLSGIFENGGKKTNIQMTINKKPSYLNIGLILKGFVNGYGKYSISKKGMRIDSKIKFGDKIIVQLTPIKLSTKKTNIKVLDKKVKYSVKDGVYTFENLPSIAQLYSVYSNTKIFETSGGSVIRINMKERSVSIDTKSKGSLDKEGSLFYKIKKGSVFYQEGYVDFASEGSILDSKFKASASGQLDEFFSSDGSKLKIEVSSNKLSFVKVFFKKISDINGTLLSKFNFSKRGDEKIINGTFDLNLKNAGLTSLGVTIKGKTKVSLNKYKGYIDSKLQDSEGGFMEMKGPYDLKKSIFPKLKLNHFEFFKLSGEKELIASGDLKVEKGKGFGNYIIRGTIKSDKTYYKIKRGFPSITEDFIGRKTEIKRDSKTLNSFKTDILLKVPNLALTGRGLNVSMGGSLKITGTLNHPVFKGKLSVTKGILKYKSLKLKVEEGKSYIEFLGNPTKPVVMLKVSKIVNNEKYGIYIKGTIGNLRTELFSSNSSSNEEILSNIIFSRGFSTLDRGGVVDMLSMLSFISDGGGELSKTKTRIEALFGIDSISFGSEKDGSTTLSLTKKIADRVDVSFENGLSDTNRSGFSVSVRMSYNLAVFFRKILNYNNIFGIKFKKSWN